MPRLSNAFLRHARTINPLLPLLLRTCRTLPSAHNELRWLREHVDTRLERKFGDKKDVPGPLRRKCVVNLAKKRARGAPLQYLLGSQPFGELDILCRKGVLIPRQATEEYTLRLADIILSNPAAALNGSKTLRILDFCTGSGCIPLLLLKLLRPHFAVHIAGIDLSPAAVSLARSNLAHNFPNLDRGGCDALVRFEHGDVLASPPQMQREAARARTAAGWWYGDNAWDVVTANPPYISRAGFDRETERSVRNFEPRLALVPRATKGANPEDAFYPPIVEKAEMLGARMLLMEVADTAQAVRVARLATAGGWRVEIWRDVPEVRPEEVPGGEDGGVGEGGFVFRGVGEGRSVVCWRDGESRVARE